MEFALAAGRRRRTGRVVPDGDGVQRLLRSLMAESSYARFVFGSEVRSVLLGTGKERVMTAPFKNLKSHDGCSGDAISVINERWEILQGSAATAQILGYHPDELIGRNYLDLIHPEDRDHSSRVLKEVLANPPGLLQWDARILNQDGKYSWVDSTVSNLLLRG